MTRKDVLADLISLYKKSEPGQLQVNKIWDASLAAGFMLSGFLWTEIPQGVIRIAGGVNEAFLVEGEFMLKHNETLADLFVIQGGEFFRHSGISDEEFRDLRDFVFELNPPKGFPPDW